MTDILGQAYPQIALGPGESLEVRRTYDATGTICTAQQVVLLRVDGSEVVIASLVHDAPRTDLRQTKRYRQRRRTQPQPR